MNGTIIQFNLTYLKKESLKFTPLFPNANMNTLVSCYHDTHTRRELSPFTSAFREQTVISLKGNKLWVQKSNPHKMGRADLEMKSN